MHSFPSISLVFGYLSPETVVPLLSVLAGGLGVVLAFGKTLLRYPLAWGRLIHRGGSKSGHEIPSPESVASCADGQS
jgi:hypothetical protein